MVLRLGADRIALEGLIDQDQKFFEKSRSLSITPVISSSLCVPEHTFLVRDL